jgi:hypothetical protein
MRPYKNGDRHQCWRRLFTVLMMATVAAPSISNAQTGTPVPRVGLLEPGDSPTQAPCHMAFRRGLRDLGYVEGQNIALDARYASGRLDRLSAFAAELAGLKPDVIGPIRPTQRWPPSGQRPRSRLSRASPTISSRRGSSRASRDQAATFPDWRSVISSSWQDAFS